MLSMPPATMTSAVPAISASCASIVAFMAEPHILLTVVQPVAGGNPRLERRLARGRLALPGRQHAAEDHLVDVRGLDTRALDGGPDRDRAEIARGERREVALESAHRGAGGADDDDRIVVHDVLVDARRTPARHFVSLNSSRPISMRRISEVPAPIS